MAVQHPRMQLRGTKANDTVVRWQAGERTIDELPLEVLGYLKKDYGAAGASQTHVHGPLAAVQRFERCLADNWRS